jgi:hypothetical protein
MMKKQVYYRIGLVKNEPVGDQILKSSTGDPIVFTDCVIVGETAYVPFSSFLKKLEIDKSEINGNIFREFLQKVAKRTGVWPLSEFDPWVEQQLEKIKE